MNINKALKSIPVDVTNVDITKLNKAYQKAIDSHLFKGEYPSTFTKLKQAYEFLFYAYLNK